MIRQGNEIQIGSLTRMTFVLSLGVLCFLFFYFMQPYHLLYEEQMQLFLFSSDYFLSYLSKPGGLACYAGDFLTQFYCIKGAGAVIITLTLGVELLLLLCIFTRIGKRENGLYAVIPVLIEWHLHLSLNYRLSSSVAFIFALGLFLLYTLINKQNVAGVFSLVITPVLYILIGGHFLTFAILVIIFDITRRRLSSFPYWLLLIGGCILCPLLLREHYLLTIEQAFFYPTDRISYFLPTLSLIFLLIGYIISLQKRSFRYQYNEVTILFIIALGLTIYVFIHTDQNKEKLLTLDSETYFNNWEKVSTKAESFQMQNPAATYFTNLAWMKQGLLADKLLSTYQPFTNGMFIPVGPRSTPLEILFSGEVYFQLGDMNMAQHATMLAMIFSPQHRSSRLIKRLTEINLIIGDTAAVDKYLRILDKTLFYSDYATGIRKIMQEGDENPWLAERRASIATYDTLRMASNVEASLTMLIKSNPQNKAALDYLLCYHLLDKNISGFISVYDKWYKNSEYDLPKLYAEGLLIALAQQKASPKVLESYKIPNELTTDFLAYTKRYQEAGGDGTELQDQYAKSYWFYYHYAQMKEQ